MEIKITVRNKTPLYTDTEIYCNNSDYTVTWDLDEEWSVYDTKTMRTTFPDSTYEDTVFTGTKVGLPVVTVPGRVCIGLYAGDIHTSAPACITAKPSILSCGGTPDAPSDDVYNQLMERMAQLETPDWAQNDESAKDYVKNRTHYEESGAVVVAHVDSDAKWEKDWYTGNQYCHWFRVPDVTLELGKTYHISIAGRTYTLECTECMVMQNIQKVFGFNLPKGAYTLPTSADLTEDLPFCMYVCEDSNNLNINLLMDYIPDPVDVTITKDVVVTHPLDEKYLPVSARRFVVTLTQDDEGNLSADKTYAEIRKAYESGEYLVQNICAVFGGVIYPLNNVQPDDMPIVFMDICSYYGEPGIILTKEVFPIIVSSDNSWVLDDPICSHELCDPVSPDYGIPEDAIPVYDSSVGFWVAAPVRAFANPTVTANDNGKVMKVVDGAWAAADNVADKVEGFHCYLSKDTSTRAFEFDGVIAGRDTFVYNAFAYYKISDFAPTAKQVVSFRGTRSDGSIFSDVTTGENCREYGMFIVVYFAGYAKLGSQTFAVPSPGLYARFEKDLNFQTAGTATFTFYAVEAPRVYDRTMFVSGDAEIILASSTPNSTKKFKLTVDDSGSISATEVVE